MDVETPTPLKQAPPSFRELFTPPHHKARLIGLFLAVLELIKQRAIGAEQPDPFGEIWIIAAVGGEAEPGA